MSTVKVQSAGWGRMVLPQDAVFRRVPGTGAGSKAMIMDAEELTLSHMQKEAQSTFFIWHEHVWTAAEFKARKKEDEEHKVRMHIILPSS